MLTESTVSHDVSTLANVCTSLWVCDNGGIEHFDGTIHDYKKRLQAQADAAGTAGVATTHHSAK